MISSASVAVSFFNHWVFADRTFAEKSWRHTFVFLLSTLDASWLNMISQDSTAVLEVKRAANFTLLVVLYGPTLVLQAAVVFMTPVSWKALDEAREEESYLIPARNTANAAF